MMRPGEKAVGMIPVYRPSLTQREKANVLDCLESSWISSKGEYIGRFETDFARYVGSRYSISVCNGTAALHLAIAALGVGRGDEIIVPTLTYIASVNAIAYTGATPVFVDSRPDSWQIDMEDVKRKFTSRTRGVLAVHLYGYPCDLDAVAEFAREKGIYLVEDCAEAVGTRFMDKHVGNWGNVSTFSFYGNKTITTGEGGMVVTSDAALADRLRRLKGQGLADNREYWHDLLGYNYRMTNICAALGVAQLERIEKILERKRLIAGTYVNRLKSIPVEFQRESKTAKHSYWMITILVPGRECRDGLRKHLMENGVETRPIFNPVHLMPMYSKPGQHFPVAEDIANRGINLPSYPDLEDSQIEYVCRNIEDFFKTI